MTKGTPSMGKHSARKSHIRCRRCGQHSFHVTKKVCSHCGFGASSKLKQLSYSAKKVNKKRKF